MLTETLKVAGISCGHCVATIEREVAALEGVETVAADLAEKVVRVAVQSDETMVSVRALLEEIGYPVAD